jgi:hypothetical protein
MRITWESFRELFTLEPLPCVTLQVITAEQLIWAFQLRAADKKPC